MVSYYPNAVAVKQQNAIVQPNGWNSGWLRAVTTGRADVAFFGDSVSQGFYATDPINNGFTALLKKSIASRYGGEYAEYWGVSESLFCTPAFSSESSTLPWTVNDTVNGVALNDIGFISGVRFGAGMANPSLTFNCPIACTAIDFNWIEYYIAGGSGFGYSIDGAHFQSPSAASNSNNMLQSRVINLPSAQHVVSVFSQTEADAFVAAGISCYPNGVNAKGIGFANFFLSGMSASDLLRANSIPNTALGYDYYNGLNLHTPSPFGFPFQPNLSLIAFGINDCQEYTRDSLWYAITKLIESIRYGQPNSSFIVLALANPDPNTSDIVTNSLQNYQYWLRDFVPALYDAAMQTNSCFVNIDALMGGQPLASGWITSAHNPHPTTLGHTFIKGIVDLLI